MSVVFLALAGRSVVHRLDGRNSSAAEAAIEALDLYLVGEPRRLANRVDPRADLLAGAAVCCTELGILAIEAGDVEHAVQLLGQAERLRSDAGVSVPGFECDGLERAVEVASSLLGPVAYQVAFDLGRAGQLGSSVMFRR